MKSIFIIYAVLYFSCIYSITLACQFNEDCETTKRTGNWCEDLTFCVKGNCIVKSKCFEKSFTCDETEKRCIPKHNSDSTTITLKETKGKKESNNIDNKDDIEDKTVSIESTTTSDTGWIIAASIIGGVVILFLICAFIVLCYQESHVYDHDYYHSHSNRHQYEHEHDYEYEHNRY